MSYSNEMSPADFAAVCGNSNGGMFGNNNDFWLLILFFWMFGYGGNGSGVRTGYPCATQADVRAAVDQQTLINKLDQQTYGIADSTYAINNAITTGFHGVDNAICNLGYNVQSGFNGLSAQLAQCCCDNRAAIADVKYQMATDTCAVQNTIQNTTRDIIENANANSRAILDAINANYVRGLENELQSYKLSASQANQNAVLMAAMDANKAEILRRTGAECPTPAYLVNAPTPVSFPVNSCGQVQFGNHCSPCGNGCF